MDAAVECTHCRVIMTSWSAPGSPVRYWQCPFCARTHSSAYGEVFRRRAGARMLDPSTLRPRTATELPAATRDEARWAGVRASAARWFARLEADEARNGADRPPRVDLRRVPEADPADVIELAPGRSSRRRR
jgi:hypothetical protein